MNTTRFPCAAALAAAACAVVTAGALAGDLNPPPGPVAPTFKTLDEVEPRIPLTLDTTPGDADSIYRIDRPGSYYLTSDTTVRAAESGIEIVVSDVTVDLMGYRLVGLAGSLAGISVASDTSHVTIRNGHITDIDATAIDAGGLRTGTVENVTLHSNTGRGLLIGPHATIVGCQATENGDDGFRVGNASRLRDCLAGDNLGIGFDVGFAVLARCTSTANFEDGFRGFGVFTNCDANGNAFDGFRIEDASSLNGCRARFNQSDGFYLEDGAVALTNCTADANQGYGFWGSPSSSTSFVGCTAKQNSLSGFYASAGSTLETCVAHENLEHGIVGSAATIRGCTARSNGAHGIRLLSANLVMNNTCQGNGTSTTDGAGIYTQSSDNRIDGNNLVSNDLGIDIDANINVIVRNSASGNTTNYEIVPNNIVGPFIDASTVATNDNPYANFDY